MRSVVVSAAAGIPARQISFVVAVNGEATRTRCWMMYTFVRCLG